MNRKQMVVLWAGVVAFVLIGLFPPMRGTTQGSIRGEWWGDCAGVDVNRMLRYWAIVAVVTGGLLWSEVQTRPWFRQRADKRKARADNPDRARTEESTQSTPARRHSGIVVAMLCVVVVLFVGFAALFTDPLPDAQPKRSRVRFTPLAPAEAEGMVVRQQINSFFAADDMKTHWGFYGKTAGQYEDWSGLTPSQKANRIEVCNRAQSMLDSAEAAGAQISTAEALRRAHLETTAAPIAERLGGISTGIDGQSRAMIGNALVPEGGTVQGYRIRKIRGDSVEFEKDGKVWVQKMQ